MPEIRKNSQIAAERPIESTQKPLENGDDPLAPYRFWGVDLTEKGVQATGDCPFCNKAGKFSVLMQGARKGLWRCFVCGEGTDKGGGNAYTFIRKLWEQGSNQLGETLTDDRGIARETLLQWDVRARFNDPEGWILAGRGIKGDLNQLYKYSKDNRSGKRILYSTKSLAHQLFGIQFYDPKKPEVWVIEGPWNAMIFWETLRCIKSEIPLRYKGEPAYSLTGSEVASLLSRINVIGVPGCNVFKEEWAQLLDKKIVTLVYDSDHPRVENGKIFRAGYDGLRRVVRILCKADATPKEVRYVEWGPEGYDPGVPSGYDFRDHFKSCSIGVDRGVKVTSILSKVKPIPSEWVNEVSSSANGKINKPGHLSHSKNGSVELEPLPCKSWKELLDGWKPAAKMHDGLVGMLGCGLATVLSTPARGTQLWMKMVGPPSSGKTTIAEALGVAKKYAKITSINTGIHSGYKEDGKDFSLLALCKNKCLIIKDGDTLLQATNKEQTLADLRDIYDRASRTHYKNGVVNEYENFSMTMLLCGTDSLRILDSSELGERYLDWVVIERMEAEMESEIGKRVAYQAIRNSRSKSDDGGEGVDSPEKVHAKRLTAGYLEYLSSNTFELIEQIEFPDAAIEQCQNYALLTAYSRSRPSKKQEESNHRELSFRLIEQKTRLALYLALALQKKSVDSEIMRYIRRVTFNTSRGRTYELIKHLYSFQDDGATPERLAIRTNHGVEKEKSYLEFLRHIDAVETFNPTKLRGGMKWRLTSRVHELYRTVIEDR